MGISKSQAEANHARIGEAAAKLYRERGFDGIGVADVMKAAGFTHGGFYNHFASKDELAAVAVRQAFEQLARERARAKDIETLLSGYLSLASRANPGRTCPAAALGGDVARQPAPVRTAFAAGLEAMIASFEKLLAAESGLQGAEARDAAVKMLVTMAGALMLARAVPDDHRLARELLEKGLSAALAHAQTAPALDANMRG